MKQSTRVFLLLMSVWLGSAQIMPAQSAPTGQTVQLSEKAQKVKKDLQKIGLTNDATIFLPGERVFICFIRQIEEDQVVIRETHSGLIVSLKYEEIQKVWRGHASQGPLGNWVKPKYRKWGAVAGFAAVLVLPLVLVATQLR